MIRMVGENPPKNKKRGNRIDIDGKLAEVREVTQEHYGEENAEIMETLLAAAYARFVESVEFCPAVGVAGGTGDGKTEMLKLARRGVHAPSLVDEFTTASLNPHTANKTEEELDEIGLLPRIDGKTLITPDLGSQMEGREEHVRKRWGRICRVLDGDGLSTSSGVHGRRETGDSQFSWLAASTAEAMGSTFWDIEERLGSRFFWVRFRPGEEDAIEALKKAEETELNEKREAVGEVLDELSQAVRASLSGGNRSLSVEWGEDPEDVKDILRRWAVLSKRLRSPVRWDSPKDAGAEPSASVGNAYRELHILKALARGRALLDGRRTLKREDLETVRRLVLDTGRPRRLAATRFLLSKGKRRVKTSAVANRIGCWIGCSKPTALRVLRELQALEVVKKETRKVEGGTGDVWGIEDDFLELT